MSAITDEIWDFWLWFDALETTVSLGGIYAAKGGYHDTRAGAGAQDYSVAEVANDRKGPSDKASAIDLTMSAAAMRKYTTRLDTACRARDERLYIGGAPIIREFIGTKDSSSVYCYVLTGGRARGLPADAGPDYSRDSSHLWHLHISIIRWFCASADAMDRLYSVLAGEAITSWRARRAPAPTPVQEDDMAERSYEIPRGYAFASDGTTLVDPSKVLIIGTSPVSLKGHPFVADRKLFLSTGSDFSPGATERIRVAIHNGGGWSIKIVTVKDSDGRIGLAVPAPATDGAYKIEISRVAPVVADGKGDGPMFLLVEII